MSKEDKSKAEKEMTQFLESEGVYFVPQYRFASPRRWLADFALPINYILIEVQGAVFMQGAHTRGVGYTDDLEKFNSAQLLGWRLFAFTTDQVLDGYGYKVIRAALGKEPYDFIYSKKPKKFGNLEIIGGTG